MKRIEIYLIYCFFLVSCSTNSGFQIYSIDGDTVNLNNRKKYYNENVQLFFSRDEIKADYTEINVIASNHHYYGDFFFDEIFMNSLNKKVSLLDVDALIFEKDSLRFSFFKEGYIYFTAIKFKD